MTHNQQIYNIGYRGASGGFLLLHFLLLSEQYYTDIFDNITFSDVIAQQWNMSDHNDWKTTEFWPSNFKSINGASVQDKVTFSCNPTVEEFFQKKELIGNIAEWYSNIKDSQWPAVTSASDLNNLPEYIYDEVSTTLDCKNTLQYLKDHVDTKCVWLYTDFDSQNELAYYKKAYFYCADPTREKIQHFEHFTATWNGINVDKNAVYFLNHSNIQIKLQDLVNSPDRLIDHGLIDQVNQNQHKLLTHWKSLHPPELLKKIGIK